MEITRLEVMLWKTRINTSTKEEAIGITRIINNRSSSTIKQFSVKRFKSEQIIKVTLLYQGVISLLLVVGTLYNAYGLYSLIGLMFIFLTGQGLIGPKTTAL